ncbi:Fc.00g053140.m01.CDS01 [Cosmosporella sp. VM-42]
MVSLDDEESQPLMTGPEQHPVDVDVVAVNSSDSDSDNARTRTRTDAGHPDAPLENGGTLEVEEDSGPPTPRFMQDEGAWKKWKWVPYSMRRVSKWIVKWSKGPVNPQPYRIKPILPVVQEFPLLVIERFIPKLKHRIWLICFYLAIWIVTFALVKRQGTLATEIKGWGEPQNIGCGVTYWGSGNSCGIDGSDCRPFNGSGFPFRCAADCKGYHVLEPRAVGDQEVIYRSLVVGGQTEDGIPVYRGDSFICGAAIHAGVISDKEGGCGVVTLIGNHKDFSSSKRNGIESVSFDSYFPLSFSFEEGINCSAQDMRWSLLAVSTVFTGVLSLFTASPALFFFPIFTGLFWTVGMALDPPPYKSIAGLVSNLLGKFLPAMFCAWVIYDKMGVRRTLKGLTAQIEKTILWLGACWVGAMENYTLSFIPIQRLNKHDLDQQPGARGALATIIILLTAIVLSQVWFFRQEGRFIKYLKLYGLFIGAIIIALVIPGLNLRIHHYILALLLLPGTSMQTRPALVYQGILVGLFISGIARWGFDPVLQTSKALQGDAQKGTKLPTISDPIINWANTTNGESSITFTWDKPPQIRYDGISVLVNDVERFRSYFEDTFDREDKFVWTRNSSLDLPEYFRFAFTEGSLSGDYTKAGIWTPEGDWTKMKPGPSRVKGRSLEEEIVRRRRSV